MRGPRNRSSLRSAVRYASVLRFRSLALAQSYACRLRPWSPSSERVGKDSPRVKRQARFRLHDNVCYVKSAGSTRRQPDARLPPVRDTRLRFRAMRQRVGIIVAAGVALAIAVLLCILGVGDSPTALTDWQAFVLGAVQGFTELLPGLVVRPPDPRPLAVRLDISRGASRLQQDVRRRAPRRNARGGRRVLLARARRARSAPGGAACARARFGPRTSASPGS